MATKKDLEKLLEAKYPDLESEDLSEIIDIVLNDIAEELKADNRIEIRGFGTISVRIRPARFGRDPRKNEEIEIPERRSIYYRMAKGALKRLNPDLEV
ncbi:MAG: himD [Rickettsiaceae bacterium]|jgi:integration host factor subunit beta|nr:himD [Rickettsiaceae bacterium]